MKRIHLPLAMSVCLLSACATSNPRAWEPAKFPVASVATRELQALPAPGQKVPIAVYGFTDQTGQFKHTEGAQTLSRAVTQGATSILVKTLQEAGNRNWFTVIERERLDNLLRERAVIREMRAAYLGERTLNRQALPPLLFAGVLLEGGIIGYDTNTKSGGAGARFLGIGGKMEYREDTVTIYLRAISVKTGEVLSTISMRKSVASVGAGANAFRYVAFKDLLELEAGVAYNEPGELALRQTVEAAVRALIVEGAMQGIWCFGTTPEFATTLLRQYVSQRDGIAEDRVVLPADGRGGTVTGACPTQRVTLRPERAVPMAAPAGAVLPAAPAIAQASRPPAASAAPVPTAQVEQQGM